MDVAKLFPELELIEDESARLKLKVALTEAVKGDASKLRGLSKYRSIPVSFLEFITSPKYLNYVDDNGNPILYPEVLKDMVSLNDGNYIEAVFTGGIGCGKALAIDTPVMTIEGLKPIGKITAGDMVAGLSSYTRVVAAHPPYYASEAYRITFSNGEKIICDARHLWSYCTHVQEGLVTTNTLTMAASFEKGEVITLPQTKGFKIAKADKPNLKTNFYALGLWLSRGLDTDGFITGISMDIVIKLRGSGLDTTSEVVDLDGHKAMRVKIKGLKSDLKLLGMMDNTSFPSSNLNIWAKVSMVQAMVDCEGVILTPTESLLDEIIKVGSLAGIPVTYNESEITRKGKVIPYWEIYFPTDKRLIECTLTEKVTVEGIEKVQGRYVRCITVAAKDNLYRIGKAGIPTHNTTAALATIAYQLYKISCLENPQSYFGLDPSSEIVFIFQSITEKIAKTVNYARFKSLIDKSPYFKAEFNYNRDVESELQFPNRVYVKPVSASDTSTIGQNVYAGIIDEINFFDVIDSSKRNVGGGVYDHAVELYNSMASRRKSRFLVEGVVQGILCLVSSKNYPNDFTERKEVEARTDKSIFVYSKRIWDIKPSDYNTGRFLIFVGDMSRPPRIITEENFEIPEQDVRLYDWIPNEFKTDFERDIMRHLRETAGVATMSLHPFIIDSDKIFQACYGTSIANRIIVDFVDTQLELNTINLRNPTAKRWIHLDLALTGDSAGFVMGHVDRFVKVPRGESFEVLPKFVIDMTLEVAPPLGSEIQFWKIRELIYTLRDTLGVPIEWVTLDTYQSADTMQILRSKGFRAGVQSIDRTMAPYDVVKNALYDGRLEMPMHERLCTELVQLELDAKKGKVDHPSRGSKDVADALAGVVYGLITRGDIWIEAGITPNNIPSTVKALNSSNMDKT